MNLNEVTLTPEQLAQLTKEKKLTVSVPRGYFLTIRINKEDDGRSSTTRVIENPVTLSSGTQVMEYKMANGATDAVVVSLPGSSMKDSDWKEYELYVSSLSLLESRVRLANRRPESERGKL